MEWNIQSVPKLFVQINTGGREHQNKYISLWYTHVHKWLPEINKQKFTHLPKLQGGVAIGGVAVEAEFVH